MTTTLRYGLACLVALMATGCGGGGSSSSGSTDTETTNSAPTRAWFYDADGAQVARMQFQYPDELTINVQLHSVGPDMVWDTGDDTSHPYLQCQYMSAPTPLLRYPDLYFHGMAGSPTGALGLAVLGLSNNGPMKCPVRNGRRLQQESGYVTGLPLTSVTVTPSMPNLRTLVGRQLRCSTTNLMAWTPPLRRYWR